SPPLLAVPLNVAVTFSANVRSPTRVKRNVPGSGPTSEADGSAAVTVTTCGSAAQAENSDVLPAASVAVAVTTRIEADHCIDATNVAFPVASVVSDRPPINSAPSP